jgi:hypothetical protein
MKPPLTSPLPNVMTQACVPDNTGVPATAQELSTDEKPEPVKVIVIPGRPEVGLRVRVGETIVRVPELTTTVPVTINTA